MSCLLEAGIPTFSWGSAGYRLLFQMLSFLEQLRRGSPHPRPLTRVPCRPRWELLCAGDGRATATDTQWAPYLLLCCWGCAVLDLTGHMASTPLLTL